MTVETRTSLELSDIEAVGFECKKCHSLNLWPLSVAKAPPVRCHCGTEQWMTADETYRELTELIRLMQRYSKGNEQFAMRFTIKPHGGA